MPSLSKLDVVNDMLAALGENPVNTLDEDHPLIASGLRMIATANLREQAKSWWFNKEYVTLTPDAKDSYIYTPADAIRVDPSNGALNYVQRGRRLYKAYSPGTADPYKFDAAVECWLIRELAFEDLPPSAQMVVSYAAQLDFQKSYDADAQKFQQVALAYRDALTTLRTEHTRNVNANLLERASTQRVMNRMSPFSAYGPRMSIRG